MCDLIFLPLIYFIEVINHHTGEIILCVIFSYQSHISDMFPKDSLTRVSTHDLCTCGRRVSSAAAVSTSLPHIKAAL